MSRFTELRDMVSDFEGDFIKFYEKGNASAGRRLRKHLMELRRRSQELRVEIIDIIHKAKERKDGE